MTTFPIKMLIAVIVGVVGGAGAMAQSQHDHAATVKNVADGTTTLSAEQIAQLLAGEGMGLAKPAELNHYPGPRHVLVLAEELKLTPEQHARVEAARAAMLAAATKLGAEIVEAERTLDMSFRMNHIDEERLKSLTATIGRLQGELRAVHLAAHLSTTRTLNPEQIQKYDVLRGYSK